MKKSIVNTLTAAAGILAILFLGLFIAQLVSKTRQAEVNERLTKDATEAKAAAEKEKKDATEAKAKAATLEESLRTAEKKADGTATDEVSLSTTKFFSTMMGKADYGVWGGVHLVGGPKGDVTMAAPVTIPVTGTVAMATTPSAASAATTSSKTLWDSLNDDLKAIARTYGITDDSMKPSDLRTIRLGAKLQATDLLLSDTRAEAEKKGEDLKKAQAKIRELEQKLDERGARPDKKE